MNDTSSTPNPTSYLPAVPASRAVVVPEPQKGLTVQRVTNLARRLASDVSFDTRWRKMVYTASQDPALRGYRCSIVFPTKFGVALLNRTSYTLNELGDDGLWVYARLHCLVGTVNSVLAGVADDHALANVRNTLVACRDLLLWTAAADLILAEEIIKANRYSTTRSYLPRELQTTRLEGVIELRSRVVYIIEALELIHQQMLQCERMLRSQTRVGVTTELRDALDWFQALMEVAESMRKPEDEPTPIVPTEQKRHWWQRM